MDSGHQALQDLKLGGKYGPIFLRYVLRHADLHLPHEPINYPSRAEEAHKLCIMQDDLFEGYLAKLEIKREACKRISASNSVWCNTFETGRDCELQHTSDELFLAHINKKWWAQANHVLIIRETVKYQLARIFLMKLEKTFPYDLNKMSETLGLQVRRLGEEKSLVSYRIDDTEGIISEANKRRKLDSQIIYPVQRLERALKEFLKQLKMATRKVHQVCKSSYEEQPEPQLISLMKNLNQFKEQGSHLPQGVMQAAIDIGSMMDDGDKMERQYARTSKIVHAILLWTLNENDTTWQAVKRHAHHFPKMEQLDYYHRYAMALGVAWARAVRSLKAYVHETKPQDEGWRASLEIITWWSTSYEIFLQNAIGVSGIIVKIDSLRGRISKYGSNILDVASQP